MRTDRGFLFESAGYGRQLGTGVRSGLIVTATGDLAMVEGASSIRQSLMLLLTTRPGERVMRPDYGCPLDRLLFWPNDATTAGLAIHYVRQAIARFERRVRIVRIDAGPSPLQSNLLEIVVDYRVRETGDVERIETAVHLGGE